MRVFMIGIGGIGMSALAQLYADGRHAVTGSDRERSPITEMLEKKGIRALVGQRTENVPRDTDLVVYSDAVPDNNPERTRARELGIRQVSYFEALGEVTRGRVTIAVAGTHGKTTTTAMLTKILKDAGEEPTAIVGSIVREFDSNYLPGGEGPFVVEACEYRDHILKLAPTFLVITNIEWDHTDWFPSLTALQDTFREAVHRVKDEGVIIANPDDPNVAPVLFGAKVPLIPYLREEVPELPVVGEFNRMNARAAKAAARAFAPGIPVADIDRSLTAFSGTWRRFERKGTMSEGTEVYDDYAHHPTAIRHTLRAAREKFPGKRITLVFHPHLYTRTRDLFTEFADELAKADRVILLPVYAAREEPVPGVTSDALADAVRQMNPNVLSLPTFEAAEQELRKDADREDVVFTVGAGDVYKLADRLVQKSV
ncbi:MAG: UDP-N-acetylmuramate--L-alanine ligase [Patescibacteria group bacterium]